MAKMTTRQAAAWLIETQQKTQLSARQLQHWCSLYIDSQQAHEPPRGLKCEIVGNGPRATYLIDPDDLVAFLSISRPTGWKPGRPRGPRTNKSDGSAMEPSPVSEPEAED